MTSMGRGFAGADGNWGLGTAIYEGVNRKWGKLNYNRGNISQTRE